MDVLTPLTPLALSIPLEVPHAGISDLNEDILHLIFEYFDLQPGSPTRTKAQNRKKLLSVAKTCKAFAKQALSLLWHVLPSLLPLLLLLPSAEVSNNHYVSLRPSLVYLSCHLILSLSIDFLWVIGNDLIYMHLKSDHCTWNGSTS